MIMSARHARPRMMVVALFMVLPACKSTKRGTHPNALMPSTEVTLLAPSLMPVPGKPITILIHGTRLMPPLMLACPIAIPQAITPSGLHRVRDLGNVYLTRRLAMELNKSDPQNFSLENLYLFGWSGALRFRSREKAGEKLYHVLREIRNNKALDNTPITVITQSHGGNVALNIASAAQKANDSTILVDRLIITGCPVQSATHECVKSPVFKHVYSLFSAGDYIQMMDLQGLCPSSEAHCKPTALFSERTFKPSSHLTQVEIRKEGQSIGHIDFSTKYFYRRLSKLLAVLEDAKKLERAPKDADGICCIDLADL